MKKILLFVLLLLATLKNIAQTPVQVNPQLLPPYSLIVSDYYSAPGNPKLNVLLLLRDVNRATINIRLRMSIESQSVRLRTKETAVFSPITLQTGVPYYLSPAELTPYFNAENLDFSGITRQQYEQTGKLPEGFYTFCFEAVEATTGLTVSNRGCSFAWMTLSDPPFLNLPAKAESLNPRNPQNIIFNWTPRHQASPNAAFVTDYIFSITELQDNAIAPEAAFMSSPPLYSDSTGITTFLYDAAKPPLIPGKRYAWRVQAKAKQGADNLAMFKNNGYSEVSWFTYQNNCPLPTGITATVQGRRVTIEWQPNPQHLEYRVDYREKNNPIAEWFSTTTLQSRIMLYDLKAGKQYEYRVGGACEIGRYAYSDLYPFTTAPENVSSNPNCGIDPNLPAPVGSPLAMLYAGDTIYAGDFKVVVLRSQGSNGNFTGEGYMSVSWLAGMNIAVRFTNIGVLADHRLSTGVIETTYDPQWSGIVPLNTVLDIFQDAGLLINSLSALLQQFTGTPTQVTQLQELVLDVNGEIQHLIDDPALPADIRGQLDSLQNLLQASGDLLAGQAAEHGPNAGGYYQTYAQNTQNILNQISQLTQNYSSINAAAVTLAKTQGAAAATFTLAGSRSFLAPGYKPVSLPPEAVIIRFKTCEEKYFIAEGALMEFKIADTVYAALFNTNADGVFWGYGQRDDFNKYVGGQLKSTEIRYYKDRYTPSKGSAGVPISVYIEKTNLDQYNKVDTGYINTLVPADIATLPYLARNRQADVNYYAIERRGQKPNTSPCAQELDSLLTGLVNYTSPPRTGGAGENWYQTHKPGRASLDRLLRNIAAYIDTLPPQLWQYISSVSTEIQPGSSVLDDYLRFYMSLLKSYRAAKLAGMDFAAMTEPDKMMVNYWVVRGNYAGMDSAVYVTLDVKLRLHILRTLNKMQLRDEWNGFANMTRPLQREQTARILSASLKMFRPGLLTPGQQRIEDGAVKEIQSWYGETGGETFVLKILTSTPVTQREELLKGLLEDDLLFSLVTKIDNAGMGEDNYNSLIGFIQQSLAQVKPAEQKDFKWFVQNDRALGWRTQWGTGISPYSVRLVNGMVKIEGSTTDSLGNKKKRLWSLRPYDWIMVYTSENLPQEISAYTGKKFITMPAIAFDWIYRTTRTRNINRVVNASLNVLSIFTGIGAIKNGITIVKVIGALDVMLSSADIFLNEPHVRDRLTGTQAGRDFLKYFNIIQASFAVADMSRAFANLETAGSKYMNKWEEAKGGLADLSETKFYREAQSYYDELADALGLSALADKLAAIRSRGKAFVNSVKQQTGALVEYVETAAGDFIRQGNRQLVKLTTAGELELNALQWQYWRIRSKFDFKNRLVPVTAAGGPTLPRYQAYMLELEEKANSLNKRLEIISQEEYVLKGLRQLIADELGALSGNAHFNSILEHLATLPDGAKMADKLVADIKSYNIAADLAGDLAPAKSYAKDIREALKNDPAAIADYKKIKDDPYYYFELKREGVADPSLVKFGNTAFFIDVTQKGKAFEKYVTAKYAEALRTRSGVVYEKLKAQIPDIDQRRAFSQVQLCFNANCTDYFIADEIFIKYGLNEAGKEVIVDIVISDTKLRDGTNFTTNQDKARGLVSKEYYVRNIRLDNDILGVTKEVIPQGTKLKAANFIKTYGNGEVNIITDIKTW
jgi:TANFOR domain-containing protein